MGAINVSKIAARDLDRNFDPGSLARGRAYARAGMVLEIRIDPDDDIVEGEVAGSGPTPYRTWATWSAGARS